MAWSTGFIHPDACDRRMLLQAGPASGTNSMPSVAALKRCMSMSSNRLAFFALRPRSPQKAISSRLAIDCAAAGRRRHPLRIPKKSSIR